MSKKGFTLIELLTVVLIIGILAAVAIPQYTKSVETSRRTEGLTMAKALAVDRQAAVMFKPSDPTSVPSKVASDLKNYTCEATLTDSIYTAYCENILTKDHRFAADITSGGKMGPMYCLWGTGAKGDNACLTMGFVTTETKNTTTPVCNMAKTTYYETVECYVSTKLE